MARPVQIDDAKLLAVALEVFLEKGVHGTTSEVAKRAGVSEGSIFKRYPSKTALFVAAMRAKDRPPWSDGPSEAESTETIRQELCSLAVDGIGFFRRMLPLAMMAWSEPSSRAFLQTAGKRSAHYEGMRSLAAYFDKLADTKRLRIHSSEAAAHAFAGALWSYASMELMAGEPKPSPAKERAFAAHLVDTLMAGLAFRPAATSKAKSGNTRVEKSR